MSLYNDEEIVCPEGVKVVELDEFVAFYDVFVIPVLDDVDEVLQLTDVSLYRRDN